MSSFASASPQRLADRVARSGLGVLLLTSVHHVYGAYIYDTPWRLHVVFVSVLAAAPIVGSLFTLQRWSTNVAGEIASWIFVALTLVLPRR